MEDELIRLVEDILISLQELFEKALISKEEYLSHTEFKKDFVVNNK